MASNADGALIPYRVIDLTEGGCNLTGRVLADLGAQVIRVEPPQGSKTRRRGPFYRDHTHPEKGLWWLFFNLDKLGITLDLSTEEGRALFFALVKESDVVIQGNTESIEEGIHFEYDRLEAINPSIVVATITPYGMDGPYARRRASDLITWAGSGMQYVSGDPDRAPLRVSVPMIEAVAATQAAAGIMHALWHRAFTGEGQHVVVSAQIAAIWTTMNEVAFPVVRGITLSREGTSRKWAAVSIRQVFKCLDGYVVVYAPGGTLGAASMGALTRWMQEESQAPDFMARKNWARWDIETTPPEEIQEMEKSIARFVGSKTKRQLYERSIRDRILIAPCYTIQDIHDDHQLKSRDFWVAMDHPDLDNTLEYPGPFAKLSATPISYRRPAPRLGEHNLLVFGGLLGLSSSEIQMLYSNGVM